MGTHSAIQALSGAIREFGRERTVVKLDVANYFALIDHGVLQNMLAEVLKPAASKCNPAIQQK